MVVSQSQTLTQKARVSLCKTLAMEHGVDKNAIAEINAQSLVSSFCPCLSTSIPGHSNTSLGLTNLVAASSPYDIVASLTSAAW